MVGCASLNAPSPNKVRIFINQTNSLDFDKAENGVPTLDVDIAKDGCNENTDAILLPKLKVFLSLFNP